jgi:glycosyltransferase involved in cell wall biosynthesis
LLGVSRKVREVVAAGRYDLVHVHTPVASWLTRYALRKRGRGAGERPCVIYTAHGFHFYDGQDMIPHAVFRTMERIAASWTDYVVTVNQQDYVAAQGFGRLDPDRVRLIRGIGVDTDEFAPGAVSTQEVSRVRAELADKEDAFVLAMVAELAPVKRHLLALDAVGRVRDPRVVLALIGDGPLESALRAEVDRLGIASQVRFAGYRRDVAAVLAASDALLICSEREGLNRSALEAMSSARPVVGTDTRGIADLIGEDTGWLVGKDDADGLAVAISEAAQDPAEAARRGAAGRERVVAEFGLSRVVAAYEELYAEALA